VKCSGKPAARSARFERLLDVRPIERRAVNRGKSTKPAAPARQRERPPFDVSWPARTSQRARLMSTVRLFRLFGLFSSPAEIARAT
jgi:hypothetical protein